MVAWRFGRRVHAVFRDFPFFGSHCKSIFLCKSYGILMWIKGSHLQIEWSKWHNKANLALINRQVKLKFYSPSSGGHNEWRPLGRYSWYADRHPSLLPSWLSYKEMQLRLPLLSPIATLPGRKERGMNKENYSKICTSTIEAFEVVTFLACCREVLVPERNVLNVRMNDK